MGALDLISNKRVLTFLIIVGALLLFLSVNAPTLRSSAYTYMAILGFTVVGAIALPRLGVNF